MALIPQHRGPYKKRRWGCRHTQRTQGEDGHPHAQERGLRSQPSLQDGEDSMCGTLGTPSGGGQHLTRHKVEFPQLEASPPTFHGYPLTIPGRWACPPEQVQRPELHIFSGSPPPTPDRPCRDTPSTGFSIFSTRVASQQQCLSVLAFT